MAQLETVIAATARNVKDELAQLAFVLDGAVASLETLDDAIDAVGIMASNAAASEEYLDGMVWGYGCYVADVLQRNYSGRWLPADDIGYEFEFRGSTLRCNPWELVERRFRLGAAIAPLFAAYTDKVRPSTAAVADRPAATTSVAIEGRGLSIGFLEIDQAAFRQLVADGISESAYQALLDAIEDEGRFEEGLLPGCLKVTVDGETFACSWDKIRPRLGDRLPQPYRAYEELGPERYLVVLERPFETEWIELVGNYRHSMLRFEVGCVEPAKGTRVMLMDFTLAGNAIAYATAYGEGGTVYVVDGRGNRHLVKLAFEW
ncbi:MAG TPA: hypothetical protein VF801_15195 [Rhodocyclaceae bacterium]